MTFDLFSGQELRDQGIQKAVDNADSQIENWSQRAYEFLVEYCKTNKGFMTEDVRNASLKVLESPPSNRAWGGIMVRARKAGLITPNGFKNVKNKKAHCTPATYWKSNN